MRTWFCAALAGVLGLLFVGSLRLPGLGDEAITLISNLGQLAAVTAASVLCWVASRSDDRHPRAWRWLSLGVGAWAAGQVVWTCYEVTGTEVPFPSLSDVGFLIFPIASGVGLLLWLGSQSTLAARARDVLDGAIIALSLLVLSWVTSLGSVVAEGGSDWLSTGLSMAYPIGDVILGTLVLLAVARGRREERDVLVVLALGLGALALADSAYLYLVSIGSYTSADVVSSGWVFGFLLVGAAALGQHGIARRGSTAYADEHDQSLVAAALPYLPFGAAGIAVALDLVRTPEDPLVDVLLAASLVVFVLARQFLAMAENRRLFVELGRAHDLLEHQALHDHLTGLPNRALFTDRLDHALQRPTAELGLLFCDLDDFKQVNDVHGHDAGDLLLQLVAERLLGCVRGEDTVARLGGDEFAMLLDNPNDAERIATRVVEQMRRPFFLGGHEVKVTMSVGVTQHWATPPPTSQPRNRAEDRLAVPVLLTPPDDSVGSERGAVAHWLLRTADQAMYTAKTSGKARAVLSGSPTVPGAAVPREGEAVEETPV
ncbi:GGDEF domain-containing protein [Nocardioides iriomotensis]|uniref:GGDEF domain-containing protein n=1 Tax=Nocardioides iriomotensis TaxID=715784 RepID=A0A4Q5IVZ4_9ACTN|nr:GGDEF domain-containing protein [Nocardioides iriomotensis]RYU10250.1 GGDEF domain-containing protein [Nocardioides iriomotensis]